MAHGLVEEWELDVADDNFDSVSEDVRWVDGGRLHFSPDDTSDSTDGVSNDWRLDRGMMSPLEGAQRELEMDGRYTDAEPSDASPAPDKSRNGVDTNSHRRGPASTGGDQFQAMDDESGDGQTYYYDEDLTRNGDFRDRTASNADLIFRTPNLIDQSRMKALLRYIIVALIAFGVGTIFGVLLDLITSSCTEEFITTAATTTTTTTAAAVTTLETAVPPSNAPFDR